GDGGEGDVAAGPCCWAGRCAGDGAGGAERRGEFSHLFRGHGYARHVRQGGGQRGHGGGGRVAEHGGYLAVGERPGSVGFAHGGGGLLDHARSRRLAQL